MPVDADSGKSIQLRALEFGIEFGFKDKLAPRVGFAYDIKGDGKWKAFGSWGVGCIRPSSRCSGIDTEQMSAQTVTFRPRFGA